MKTILLLSIIAPLFCTSQLQFDYLGGLPVNSNYTGCFYIDLNTFGENTGVNDVVFVHGNGEIYFQSVLGDSLRIPANSPRAINGKYIWADCDTETNIYNRNKVYVISEFGRLSNGSHVIPFKYNGLYNFIIIRVENEMIYIRGWVFNITADQFKCFHLPLPIKNEK